MGNNAHLHRPSAANQGDFAHGAAAELLQRVLGNVCGGQALRALHTYVAVLAWQPATG